MLIFRKNMHNQSSEVPMIKRRGNNKYEYVLGLSEMICKVTNNFTHFIRVLTTQLTPSFQNDTIKSVFLNRVKYKNEAQLDSLLTSSLTIL